MPCKESQANLGNLFENIEEQVTALRQRHFAVISCDLSSLLSVLECALSASKIALERTTASATDAGWLFALHRDVEMRDFVAMLV